MIHLHMCIYIFMMLYLSRTVILYSIHSYSCITIDIIQFNTNSPANHHLVFSALSTRPPSNQRGQGSAEPHGRFGQHSQLLTRKVQLGRPWENQQNLQGPTRNHILPLPGFLAIYTQQDLRQLPKPECGNKIITHRCCSESLNAACSFANKNLVRL